MTNEVKLTDCIQTWLAQEPTLKQHYQVVSGRPAPSPFGQSTVEYDRIECKGSTILAVIHGDHVMSLGMLEASDPQFFEKLRLNLVHLHSVNLNNRPVCCNERIS